MAAPACPRQWRGALTVCGLAGVVAPGREGDARRFIEDAVATHACRGPDHRTIVALPGDVMLGHNRLSIIDLSDEANQPLWDAEGRRCVVLNGEIYNYLELRDELVGIGHRFRTSSDTEVLLTAFNQWGDGALERLRGMFAFAVYEPEVGRMWLARDRFGVKPLYYRHDDAVFAFSSTPAPIARGYGSSPDLGFVGRGLRYWLYETDDSRTQYTGVHALRAGHFMAVERSPSGAISVQEQRYYDFGERVQRRRRDMARQDDMELTQAFTERLRSGIDLRLRSDVPIGVSLSGGLDSSSILALASERTTGLVGITFGDPAVAATEGPAVRAIAAFTKTRARFVWPSAEDLINAYDETLVAQDAPFNDVSVVAQFLVFRAAREEGLKVMLGGQGADEVLMGYRKYQLAALRDTLRRGEARSSLRHALSTVRMVQAELGQASLYLRQLRRYVGGRGLHSLVSADTEPFFLGADGDARSRQVADIVTNSLPTLLRYEDRNSMGNGVESRLPFMDHELAEFSVAMPTAAKLRNGYGKWVLRAAMRDRLPPPVLMTRRKVGFTVQQDAWIRDGLGEHVRSRLRSQPSVLHSLLPRDTDLDIAFSDHRLARSATAFADATALIWLGQVS